MSSAWSGGTTASSRPWKKMQGQDSRSTWWIGEPALVCHAGGHQVACGVQAVLDVDLAPAAVQALAIGAAVAGAAAVVDVAQGKAARGPELVGKAQLARGRAGRAAMALDDQGRAVAPGGAEVGVGRGIVEGVRRGAAACERDRLGPGEKAGIDRDGAGRAELRDRTGRGIGLDDRRRPIGPAGA